MENLATSFEDNPRMSEEGFVKKEKIDLSNYWYNRATDLHRSALILYDTLPDGRLNLYDPCLLVAGLSIEVMAKANQVKRLQKFDDSKYKHHLITKIIDALDLPFNEDQLATLRIFEESVIWLGKYPRPKNMDIAREKMDALWEKNGEPGWAGQVLSVSLKRWPTKENYLCIWQILFENYWETPTFDPNEFGFKPRLPGGSSSEGT